MIVVSQKATAISFRDRFQVTYAHLKGRVFAMGSEGSFLHFSHLPCLRCFLYAQYNWILAQRSVNQHSTAQDQ